MKLLPLELNNILLLNEYDFADHSNNVDYLSSQASKTDNPEQQLVLLSKATKIIEKFHSYFHYEQSYFHLQLAILLLQDKRIEEAREQLNLAIFQDHLNHQAIELLDDLKLGKIYQRPFVSFVEYLSFASGEQVSDASASSFWLMPSNNIGELTAIIAKIRDHHLNYHEQAAKLYLNRALAFYTLEQEQLSNNDLIKAINLDGQLKQRDYYLEALSQMTNIVVLGLGSNLGDRARYLKQAIELLQDMQILECITCSSIMESAADLQPNSPLAWDLSYLNMAITGFTKLLPEQLLQKIKEIEQFIGRSSTPRWAPREIDIDILAYANKVVNQDNLQIPHPALIKRSWAVIPFAEIYPSWTHPILAKTIQEIKDEY